MTFPHPSNVQKPPAIFILTYYSMSHTRAFGSEKIGMNIEIYNKSIRQNRTQNSYSVSQGKRALLPGEGRVGTGNMPKSYVTPDKAQGVNEITCDAAYISRQRIKKKNADHNSACKPNCLSCCIANAILTLKEIMC